MGYLYLLLATDVCGAVVGRAWTQVRYRTVNDSVDDDDDDDAERGGGGGSGGAVFVSRSTKFSQLVLSAFLNGNLLLQSEVPGDILAAGAQRVPQW